MKSNEKKIIILLQTFITFIFISTAVNAELKCNTNTKDVWNIFGGDTISYNFSKCEWLTINITPTILGEWRASPNCIEQTAGNFYCACKDKWNLSLSPKPNSVGIFKLIIKNYYEELPKLAVTIFSPQNISYNKNYVSLNFVINRPTSWIGYSLDNQPNKTITGNTTITSLTEGLHNIIVYANDSSGSSAKSSKVYFTVDLTNPKITIISPQNKTYYKDSVPLNFTINEPFSWIGYSLDKTANKTIKGNTTLNDLKDGAHNIIVYVTDKSLNTGASNKVYFSYCLADVNGDKKVNWSDLSLEIKYFGYKCGNKNYNSAYDLNDDCSINIFDILIILSQFGKTCKI